MTEKKQIGDRPLIAGNHMASSPDVTEGGKAPSPTEGGHGHPKPSASKAMAEDRGADGTSGATQGRDEKDHAAGMGAGKPRSAKAAND